MVSRTKVASTLVAKAAAKSSRPASRNKDEALIKQALRVLDRRLRRPGAILSHAQDVKNFLRLTLADREHEVFGMLLLTTQNGLIATVELFRGTLAQTSVYPREVMKTALQHNAAAVIYFHNHPSGVAEPSCADQRLTQVLKEALNLIDIRTLDHFIVAGDTVTSLAERSLI